MDAGTLMRSAITCRLANAVARAVIYIKPRWQSLARRLRFMLVRAVDPKARVGLAGSAGRRRFFARAACDGMKAGTLTRLGIDIDISIRGVLIRACPARPRRNETADDVYRPDLAVVFQG